MRICTASTLAVILLFAGTGRPNAQTLEIEQNIEKTLELKKLQGVWVPKFLITTRGLEEYPVQGRVLVFQQNDFVRMEGARVVMTGTFGINPSTEVWQLDLIVTGRKAWDFEFVTAEDAITIDFFPPGLAVVVRAPSPLHTRKVEPVEPVQNPKERYACAYRVVGDLLTICYDLTGKGRPADLRPGEGRFVLVYQRDKKK
jgi:hypothetical protein